MCPDCGAELGHYDWCREGRAEAIRRIERKSSEIAVEAAKKIAKAEVIAEVSGWLKAKISFDNGHTSEGTQCMTLAYNDVLRYLERLKTD